LKKITIILYHENVFFLFAENRETIGGSAITSSLSTPG